MRDPIYVHGEVRWKLDIYVMCTYSACSITAHLLNLDGHVYLEEFIGVSRLSAQRSLAQPGVSYQTKAYELKENYF